MELTRQEQTTLDMLEMLVRNGDSVTSAAGKLKTMGLDPSQVEHIVEVRQQIAAQRQLIAMGHAVVDPEDAPQAWYVGPSPDDLFWPSLRSKLESDPKWVSAVPSLDASSTDVVGLLADPHSPTIRTRGLVVGHVQSGKTANFTASIAKAADAGYRLFIVLSGVHNALRKQTQQRLDDHLYDLQKARWIQLTDEDRDFGNPVKALALLQSTDLRIYAVVKKNVSRLTRLREWLREAHRHGGLDTCPVLIIDDESDQASPNAAANAELDRTRVNERIMELLELPRVAYVGYTATPFANVLINPGEARGLYPRDFIYALEKPETYSGSEELFGLAQSEDEEDESTAPHDMIRLVPDDEAVQYVVTRDQPFEATITEALGEAIRWFILATAARRLRSGTVGHSSMLVHTTMRVDPQLQFVPRISEYVDQLRQAWVTGERDIWRDQWVSEQEKEDPSRSGHDPIPFEQLSPVIQRVLREGEVSVVADNSRSTERLIYGDDPATVIAVGGNTLSRGLTLEGLVSSFFLRSASTYDSLLQMGRWFGYRPGYEDLPRIWTTNDLAEDFRFLSDIESELRSEIARYGLENAKPIELPVRIRTHPRMQVTARNKMQFAVPGEASYSASRPQTTYFNHRDPDSIADNRTAGHRLVSEAIQSGAAKEIQDSRIVLRDVPADLIEDFVDHFRFHQDTELRSDLLLAYIAEQREFGALETWNIAVLTRRGGNASIDLGLGEPVATLTRSKLSNPSSATTANIGTLMSKPDRVADLIDSATAATESPEALLRARNDSARALLILYPIDKDSEPKPRARKYREKLEAEDHLLGVAFSFPSADPRSETTDRVQVDPALLFTAPTEDDYEYVDTEGDRDEVDLDG